MTVDYVPEMVPARDDSCSAATTGAIFIRLGLAPTTQRIFAGMPVSL